MTVYVDELRRANPTSARVARAGMRHGHLWCHMMADTEEELHAFAAKLKMPREWYHGDHYDLTPTRRVHALDLGATETTARFLVDLRQLRLGLVPFKS